MPAHQGTGNAFHGAGQSQVGHRAFYEAGDQRKESRAVTNERDRYKDGKVGSQQNLSTSMFPNPSRSIYLCIDLALMTY